MSMFNAGAAFAPKSPAFSGAERRALREMRKKLKNALLVDQTRSWLELGSQQVEVLRGFSVTLSIAGYAMAFDRKSEDGAGLSIIRGALSAIEQCCLTANAVMDVATAKALGAAAVAALGAVENGSDAAMMYAAQKIHQAGWRLPT